MSYNRDPLTIHHFSLSHRTTNLKVKYLVSGLTIMKHFFCKVYFNYNRVYFVAFHVQRAVGLSKVGSGFHLLPPPPHKKNKGDQEKKITEP